MSDTDSSSIGAPAALPHDRQPAIRVLAMPADTNAAGDIFGGWLMSQVDIAGSIAAYQHARGRIVTVAVNSFQFIKPVFVGDLVSCYSHVVSVGHSSMVVEVEAYAQRERGHLETELVAQARLTYVAIDADRRPRQVDPLGEPD
ncbi:MAG TPA: acyl-CoA thioesterase [Gammaproteobacteria bacterium]|nr:acyl-CoA thioesterase [Gammaproteobacteria bacterium]